MTVRLKITHRATHHLFMCGHLGKGIGQMGHYLIDTVGNFIPDQCSHNRMVFIYCSCTPVIIVVCAHVFTVLSLNLILFFLLLPFQ